MGIKEKEDYEVRIRSQANVTVCTDTEVRKGQKRRGVLEVVGEDDYLFKEYIQAKRIRSKQIARTGHFSVLARPDGTMYGTFHFDPNKPKIKGKLSAEFWQAICLALNLKITEANEQNDTN